MELRAKKKRQEHTQETWKLESEFKILKREDKNKFYSMTQQILGEIVRQFET